ncbi:MAG: glycosyltransferase [Bacteroidota bacterium]
MPNDWALQEYDAVLNRIAPGAYSVVLARSTDVDPDPRAERTAECLSVDGYRCLIVGWNRRGESPTFQSRGEVDILRIPLDSAYGSGLKNLGRQAQWNARLCQALFRLRPAIVHAFDLDCLVPALSFKVLCGAKVVYDIADWYSASRRIGSLAPVADLLERSLSRLADGVVLAHEARLTQLGYTPRRWTVSYNLPDFDGTPPPAPSAGEPYVAYVGVLHQDRGLSYLLHASVRAGVRLVVGGFGPLESLVARAAQESGSVGFLGRISYADALRVEEGALAVVGLYDPAVPNNRLAAPNKLFEAMALGKPFITTTGTLAGKIVEETGIGLSVPYGDTTALAEALIGVKVKTEARLEMGARASSLYRTTYSPSANRERLLSLYREIDQRPERSYAS